MDDCVQGYKCGKTIYLTLQKVLESYREGRARQVIYHLEIVRSARIRDDRFFHVMSQVRNDHVIIRVFPISNTTRTGTALKLLLQLWPLKLQESYDGLPPSGTQ